MIAASKPDFPADESLLLFVDVYVRFRRATEATAKAMRAPVRSLFQMAGRVVPASELSLALIGQWTDWRRERGKRPTTLRAQRDFLFALWRLASDMGIAATAPPAWTRQKHYTEIGTTRLQLLRMVDDNPRLTAEQIRQCLAYFNLRGVKLPALAEQMGISYSYLNAVAYKSKPVTPQFRNRLRSLLIEASGTVKAVGGGRPKRRRARPPERLKRLTYDELVASLDKPEWTSADVWPVVNYCFDHAVTRRKVAGALGVSYDHLNAVLYQNRAIGPQLRERFRKLLSQPLAYHAEPAPGEPLAPDTPRRARKPVPICIEPVAPPSGIMLDEYLKDYVLGREMSKQHAAALAQVVRLFGRFLARPATMGDLQPRLVNQWLVALAGSGLQAASVRGYRQKIVALWNAAYRDEPPLVDQPPLRVRPIKKDRRMPEAWNLDQMRSLLKQADSQRGVFPVSRVPRRGYWRAFILLSYNTGLRLGDLERLTFAEIGDGVFSVNQHKTGKPIMCSLHPETMKAIEEVSKPIRDRIIGGVINRRAFFQRFRELTDGAGLVGTWRKIRRTSGTLVESIAPGMGHAHLGNGADVFAAHYLDQRHLTRLAPQPPRLTEEGDACDQ